MGAVVAAMALLVAACGGGDDAPAAPAAPTTPAAPAPAPEDDGEGTVLNIYLYQAPVRWSPFMSYHGPDQQIMDLLFPRLVASLPELSPWLAESWEISPDGTTFTFNLRRDAVWSDGTPITAADAKFAFDRLATEGTSTSHALFASVVGYADNNSGATDGLAGFRVVDDHTFEIELSAANVAFLATLAAQSMFVLPSHVLGDVPLDELAEHPFFLEPTVTGGAYLFTEYRVDEFVELTRNPDFFLGKPGVERLVFRQLTSDVAAAQLGTGEIDVAFISAIDAETVGTFANVTVEGVPGTGFIRMGIDLSDPRFQDKRVRQALHYAIDREGIVNGVLDGFGTVVTLPWFVEWAIPAGLETYDYNPEKARALLAEAGWDSSVPVEIQWIAGTRDRDATVPIIQQQWNAVGVTTEIINREVGPLVARAQFDRETGRPLESDPNFKGGGRPFDFTLFGGGVYNVDPATAYPISECNQLWLGPDWCKLEGVEDMLAMWRTADATADFAERQRLYHELARWWVDEMPLLNLYNPDVIWAYNNRVQNFTPNGNFVDGFILAHEWRVAR
jgi:ABC-type transport system substrate-binding protein